MVKNRIYVGSFDIFTIGHKSIVDKSLKIFDKVIIGIDVSKYLSEEILKFCYI